MQNPTDCLVEGCVFPSEFDDGKIVSENDQNYTTLKFFKH